MKELPSCLGTGENPLPILHIYTYCFKDYPLDWLGALYISKFISPLPPTDRRCPIPGATFTVRDDL